MTGWAGKTYWLVGASEGLGRALAVELAAAGATLCLSARNENRLAELAGSLPGHHAIAPCDVRDSESVRAAFANLPPLDGVIYNAAFYEPVDAMNWNFVELIHSEHVLHLRLSFCRLSTLVVYYKNYFLFLYKI